MQDKDKDALLRRAKNLRSLSSNDVYELKRIYSVGTKPWAQELNRILDRAYADDDAVILKAAIKGSGSLSSSERYRLDEAIAKRGRKQL